jgi:hypothetical protein
VSLVVDRPLNLGEVLAETVRLYGERAAAALGLGGVVAGALYLALVVDHIVVFVAVLAVVFTLGYGAAARLVHGDAFSEAWAQVLARAPVLAVLTVVVSVPFAIGRIDPFLFVFAVLWLAFSGYSIPVAVLERADDATTWTGRLGFALWRSVRLARAEYLHSLGVTAVLAVSYFLLSAILAGLLSGFGENSDRVAAVLSQVVLAPFLFLGLSVLYFDQRARALSSPSDAAGH